MSVVYLGKGRPFSQRHFTWTKTPFCPPEAILHAGNLRRSPVTLASVRNDIFQFGGPSVPEPRDPLYWDVLRKAAQAWRLDKPVNPIHLNDLPQYRLDTDSSSPGLPWKNDGFKNKRQVMDDPIAFGSIRSFWHRVKYLKAGKPADCAAYLRAHLVEEGDLKVRAVWGYPATIGFQEACFALPLIDAFKKARFPIAYGYETATGGCRRLRDRFHTHRNLLTVDFKSFDKFLPAWIIRHAFSILCLNIDFTRYKTRGIPDALALYNAWNYIVDYFINTPVRLCNGERYRKRRGVASGSYFTQLVDSIANYIMIQYAVARCGSSIKDILVLGDDSLVATTGKVELTEMSHHLRMFGMTLNLKKSSTPGCIYDATFLGYQIRNGVPLKPEAEFWAALVHPEHPDQSWDEYATRACGLVLASFAQHDRFYDILAKQLKDQPFKPTLKPGLRRYLQTIGYTTVPSVLPSKLSLAMMSER
uniref:RdRp n=1 Tax=Sanxia water strider virus 18 TaxID=1923402 RepID=A0A1L3KLS7_9VIRU|nr:RdRp [Sanxia water strider virus 18]